ncbi:MAG: hypothetical protein ACKOSQ_03030 [Planctomycetaceae bacterium]
MSRSILCIAGIVMLTAPAPARAQYHHHHHHHGSSHWYTPSYPTYPSYSSPIYVSPSTPVTAAPVMQNALPYTGPGVTIVLEQQEGGAVAYTIDGRESATIQAGQAQTLTSKGKYEIRFSRGRTEDGREFGEARYTITEGNYHFKVTDRGWELFRDKDQPNIVTTPSATPAGIRTNVLPSRTPPATPGAGG